MNSSSSSSGPTTRGSGIVRAVGIGPLPAARAAAGAINIVDLGGPVIAHVHVQLIFWGAGWAAAASPSVNEVVHAVSSILTGPYTSALIQYRGIAAGTLIGHTVASTSDPPLVFSYLDIENLIGGLFNGGTVVAPSADPQILYVVIMPPGVQYNTAGVLGEHSYSISVPPRFRYAWVTNDGTLDLVTEIFSHELVEACSDPEGNGFQIAPANSNSWNEIGDSGCGCEGDFTMVNGVSVQKYWSQQDGRCVAPGSI
jgi:hypothetical protein